MGKCNSKDPYCPSEVVTKLSSHRMCVMENLRPIRQYYSLDGTLQSVGRDCSIGKAMNLSTGLVQAVKSSKKRAAILEQLQQEIAIMKMMDHPNIVKLVETFEDQRSIHLVMEMCSGGLLIDSIIEVGTFSEKHAAILMKDILRAVFFMHENGVCHRDLNVDKFMFLRKAPIENGVLKLVDFTSACFFQEGAFLYGKMDSSSASYFAPEIFDCKYNEKCDMWSCGVIMFILLTGRCPFSGRTPKEIAQKVRRAELDFDAKCWSVVSDDAKHLARKLLKVRLSDRYSADQALKHAWVMERAPKAASSLNLEIINNLRSFQNETRLKKVALQVMVGQLTDDHIGTLRQIFNALDENGDGMLTVDEMKEGLNNAGLTEVPANLQQAIEDIDFDGSGCIDYSEFLAAALERKYYLEKDACWNVFSFFDRDGDGQISHGELLQVLNSGNLDGEVDKHTLDQVLQEVDANGDGAIDFEEFMHMMRHTTG